MSAAQLLLHHFSASLIAAGGSSAVTSTNSLQSTQLATRLLATLDFSLGDFDYAKRAVLYPAVHMPPCDNPSGIVPPKGNDCSKPIQVSHDNISGASNRML